MNALNLSDIVFFGWYHILDKTIYSIGAEKGAIGAKEHSFFITFLFHGINLWTILRYLMATYLNADAPFYLSLSLCVLVFTIGYFMFFKKKAEKVITHYVKNAKVILFVIIALIYAVVSVYLMFKVGNYVKDVVLQNS